MRRILGKLKFVSPQQEALADELVSLVNDLPYDAGPDELAEHSGFWLAMDKIVGIWSKIDPDGLEFYHKNIKEVNSAQWDKRYASTKNKNIRWRARFPFMLIAILRKLFPNFSLTEEFGRRFVARYRSFRVGEKD